MIHCGGLAEDWTKRERNSKTGQRWRGREGGSHKSPTQLLKIHLKIHLPDVFLFVSDGHSGCGQTPNVRTLNVRTPNVQFLETNTYAIFLESPGYKDIRNVLPWQNLSL